MFFMSISYEYVRIQFNLYRNEDAVNISEYKVFNHSCYSINLSVKSSRMRSLRCLRMEYKMY